MRILISLASLILLTSSGCSRVDVPDRSSPMAGGKTSNAIPVEPAARSMRGIDQRQRFASMPNRGVLVAYRNAYPALQDRAYTWREVTISEAHALDAIGGEMAFPDAAGNIVRLQYVRHAEHPDGNWTWVGRAVGAQPGEEAVITFGDNAVFGAIPSESGIPLKLTSLNGRAWIVETDPDQVGSMPGAMPRDPDALIVPENRIAGAGVVTAADRLASSDVPQVGAAVPVNTSVVVDLLLGFTNGFANRLGGVSQANTRLTNLVDITNQAYLNSNVAARVRLVGTVQVMYPDATSNTQALNELTGNGVSVPAALQTLHAARDQYGADLISLVRNFHDAENGNCGVAWILGGGQSGLDSSDAPYGMSIVSDSNGTGGPGSFPSNGYICRDETLAHELGHNMGSQHDAATARGSNGTLDPNEYGRYPYSFGYKTDSATGNFYTVMAYGESGQRRFRVFSSPDISVCNGFACGIPNQADNARSLRQTMPVAATFRGTLIRFSDVLPGHWAFTEINRLGAAGVSAGCTDASPWAPLFCTGEAVLRDQMAVFLLRVRYGGGYAPPTVTTSRFVDVPTTQWAISWIEKLAADQITTGCAVGPLRYCPTSAVSRAEMAVFILRTKYGANYAPPAPTGVFQDVPTNHWAAAWIEKLAADGITGGCSVTPRLYCPDEIVTRDQMAVFLVRGFAL